MHTAETAYNELKMHIKLFVISNICKSESLNNIITL